jgi:hypothetical protein
MDPARFDQLTRGLSRRAVIGGAAALATWPLATPAKKRRKRCRRGRIRCDGVCLKRKRTTCCQKKFGVGTMVHPATYTCCRFTDDDQLGGACPSSAICCRTTDGERLCVPAGSVCCPGGGSCPSDYPVCCGQRIEGQPVCAVEAWQCQFN